MTKIVQGAAVFLQLKLQTRSNFLQLIKNEKMHRYYSDNQKTVE